MRLVWESISNQKKSTIKISTYISVSIVCLCGASHLYGQNNDFKLWLGAEASKEVIKNLDVGGRIQSRLGQNASFSEKYLAEIGFQYAVKKY